MVVGEVALAGWGGTGDVLLSLALGGEGDMV